MSALLIQDVPIECINKESVTYHLPAKLLIAVLNTEGGKKGLIKKNRNGSYDLGEMQINTRWWPRLYQFHITPQDVLTQPCINLEVGAWILARAISEGNNLLQGIGNYNSHTPIYNHRYTEKIREQYTALEAQIH